MAITEINNQSTGVVLPSRDAQMTDGVQHGTHQVLT